jgi:ribonuclease HII
VEPSDFFEREARECGYEAIAGLDEAGRGPLAGPVVAAVVMLPVRCRLPGLNDSKVVPASDRDRLHDLIRKRAVAVGIGSATEREIDVLNILEATRLAMRRAIHALPRIPDFLLLDAITLPGIRLPQRPIIKGDGFSVSIAAASIMAKVTRDRLMTEYDRRYPRYNFGGHKGYATPEHLRLLAQHGPCEAHRHSFRPVAHSSEEETWDLFE